MRGLVLDGVGEITYREDLPEPQITAPTDALVAVRRAGLCGSDLHPYQGRERVRFGVIAGHEAVGEIVEVGDAVEALATGTRVLVPFSSCCGSCDACRRGLTSRCRWGELFGFGDPDDPGRPALQGCQAEVVRVPLAQTTLVAVPETLSDAAAILLTDNFAAGWEAVERADLDSGDTAVVVGLGAVGLCAVAAAYALGARRVVAVDPIEIRRDVAAALGAITTMPAEAAAAVALESDGRGADAAIEAAGTTAAQALGFSLLRPGGTLSVVAVQTSDSFAFTPVQAYDANLTVRFGRASVRATLDRLLPRLADGLPLPVDLVVSSDHVPLAEGPERYRRFAARNDGAIKVLFAP